MPVVGSALKLTQPATVHEPARSSEAVSGTFTYWLLPLNVSASPMRPVVIHVGVFIRVPVLLLPEESAVVVPLPSSNFQ